jgi:hypothetical protein
MDILYERNVATLFTTIISNLIGIAMLGSAIGHMLEKLVYEEPTIIESILSYLLQFWGILAFPSFYIFFSAYSLFNFIRRMCLGIPYRYIRLLSDARYFASYNTQDEMNNDDEQDNSEESYSGYIGDKQIHSDNAPINSHSQVDIHKSDEDTLLPTVWLPKFWPKYVKEKKGLQLMAPPDENYISDPTCDKVYSVKSGMGCLFGVVQCVSTMLISSIRLQNMDTVHTMDVISMYTSYILLCTVIGAWFNPTYYFKPIVCIPRNELKKYTTIDSKVLFKNLRLRIHSLDEYFWALLIGVLLHIPTYSMGALLVYINRNSMLLMSLSVAYISVIVIMPFFILFAYCVHEKVMVLLLVLYLLITPGLPIALLVYSCLDATAEQKYPSSASWLPHF